MSNDKDKKSEVEKLAQTDKSRGETFTKEITSNTSETSGDVPDFTSGDSDSGNSDSGDNDSSNSDSSETDSSE